MEWSAYLKRARHPRLTWKQWTCEHVDTVKACGGAYSVWGCGKCGMQMGFSLDNTGANTSS